jgi:hypothetical protein
MSPKVYVETSVVSYLTSMPSRDVVVAAHQQITLEWWATRDRYDLFVSEAVLAEAGGGDAVAAQRRLSALAPTSPTHGSVLALKHYVGHAVCNPRRFALRRSSRRDSNRLRSHRRRGSCHSGGLCGLARKRSGRDCRRFALARSSAPAASRDVGSQAGREVRPAPDAASRERGAGAALWAGSPCSSRQGWLRGPSLTPLPPEARACGPGQRSAGASDGGARRHA